MKKSTHCLPVRCVFSTNSDVQPLLNQGARKSDISACIFYAVVNQTIGGLAQGRTIEGNVVFWAGPLTFLSELRKSFDATLGVDGTCPEHSRYYCRGPVRQCWPTRSVDIDEVIAYLSNYHAQKSDEITLPLFASQGITYNSLRRHAKNTVESLDPKVPRRAF
jgi:hypothetical protein